MNSSTMRVLKILILIILTAICVYFLYSAIASYILWTWQPKFINSSGITTVSYGYIIQMIIFLALFVIFAVIAAVSAYFMFRKKKK